MHYGVLGMHWGVHRTRHDKSLRKARTVNIDSWGRDPQHNILYITGYSGSGKSTIARQLSNSKTNVIHLDPYFEEMDKNISASIQDKEFNKFLEKNFPAYKSIANPTKNERHSKEWWNKVDTLMTQTEKFAEGQFYKKKKVVVEGVQLSDDTTYPNKSFFKDKPLIITGTNAITSFLRASKRDDRRVVRSFKSGKEYAQWYMNTNKNLDLLAKQTSAKKGEEWANKYLSTKQS